MEHIDLRKFLPGFVMSYQMPYFQARLQISGGLRGLAGFQTIDFIMLAVQVYPNSIPWNLGTANDISYLGLSVELAWERYQKQIK